MKRNVALKLCVHWRKASADLAHAISPVVPQDGLWRINMRRLNLISIIPLFSLILAEKALSIGDYGPDTCMKGFVWREACGPTDHVCVTPETRAQALLDNQAAASRVSAIDRSFGPDTCKSPFVWREACGPSDHVCVTVEVRSQVAADRPDPRNPADRRKYPYCRDYARDAVNANQLNQLYRCSLNGNRWQSNETNHFYWCLNSPERNVQGERYARYKELTDCNETAGQTARAGKSFPDRNPSGDKCCVIPGGIGPDGRPIPPLYGCGPQCP